ncbi:hypothetical protein F5Y19DRAFT_478693 [Xylariaceae sp. FL1651]|nr:hypothetical protein F5Y19DRAFT_478693 [Xylariaceae sp. FL1651]
MDHPKRKNMENTDERSERAGEKRSKLDVPNLPCYPQPTIANSATAQPELNSSNHDLQDADGDIATTHKRLNMAQDKKADNEADNKHEHPNKTRDGHYVTREYFLDRLSAIDRQNEELMKRLEKRLMRRLEKRLTKRLMKRLKTRLEKRLKARLKMRLKMRLKARLEKRLEKRLEELKRNAHELTSKQAELDEQQLKLADGDMERFGAVRQSGSNLDSTLEEQFLKLRRHVESFTIDLCDRTIKPSSIPDLVKLAMHQVSGIPHGTILRSGLHARRFIEGFIWHFLCTSILESPFGIWGETAAFGETLTKIQNHPTGTLTRRNYWRAFTGQLLSDMAAPRRSRLEWHKRVLTDNLRPLVKPEHEVGFAQFVGPILDQAVELADSLARSIIYYKVQRQEPGANEDMSQPMVEDWMEIVEKSVAHYEDIDFIVSPALIQLGNSAGERFSKPIVNIKAQVCFGNGRYHFDTHPTTEEGTSENNPMSMTQSRRKTRPFIRVKGTADGANLEAIIQDDHERASASESDESTNVSVYEDD